MGTETEDRVTRGEIRAIAQLTIQNHKDLETLLENQKRLYHALDALTKLLIRMQGTPMVVGLKLGLA